MLYGYKDNSLNTIYIDQIMNGFHMACDEACKFANEQLAKNPGQNFEESDDMKTIYKKVAQSIMFSKLSPDEVEVYSLITAEIWMLHIDTSSTAKKTMFNIVYFPKQTISSSKIVDGMFILNLKNRY